MATCADCRHAAKNENQRICRRYPPVVNSIPVMAPPDVRNPQGGLSIANQVIFPTVDPAWACGEHSPALAPLSVAPWPGLKPTT